MKWSDVFIPKRYDRKHTRRAVAVLDNGDRLDVIVYFTYKNPFTSVLIDDCHVCTVDGKVIDVDRLTGLQYLD